MSSPEKHHLAQFILFFALVLIGTANFSYSVNSQTCNIPRYAHSPNHVTSWKISTEVIVQLDSSFSVTERDGIAAGNALWNNEAVFFNLRLWRDENHDGVSQSMELKSLRSLGIAVINLNYKESRRIDRFGNQFRYRAKVEGVHGTQVGRWAYDVLLTTK